MSKEIAEEYASSLADLTVNSKPLINMLTILAEENIDHAGVIVETVEKHLEKVQPEIKLPVLYLVDSIIKNVGGAYTQKFSQSIVNMFTRTFKQVDEKIRSQMFKLRETWHDVFPATKLYQLDVKVNLIDPAWPIQAQPHQSNIHNVATTSTVPPVMSEEERSIIAKKEQELLMLQKKKIEMELEQTRKQLELAEKNAKKIGTLTPTPGLLPTPMPVAMVNPVVAPALIPQDPVIPIKQRLGPPVNKSGARIAPVSGALAAARRDPRLARQHAPATTPATTPALPAGVSGAPPVPELPIAPHVFDIKPLERVTKRNNVITIDVCRAARDPRDPRDPRRRDDKRRPGPRGKFPRRRDERKPDAVAPVPPPPPSAHNPGADAGNNRDFDALIDKMQVPDPKKINKLPPIPKISRDDPLRDADAPIPKRRKEGVRDKKKRRDEAAGKNTTVNNQSSPEKKLKGKDGRKRKEARVDEEPEETSQEEVVMFKELKNYHKERYMRRNKEKSESPEVARAVTDGAPAESEPASVADAVVENKDVDLRVLAQVVETPATISQKRSSTEALEGKAKKNKSDKFDILFGNEDVDLRQLPQLDEVATAPPPPSMTHSPERKDDKDVDMYSPKNSPKQKDWNEVKEKDKSEAKKSMSKLDLVRAKLAEATKGKDRLGRPLLFSKSPSIEKERRRTLSSEDTDLRTENGEEFDAEDHKKTISIIMSQAKEQFTDGQLDKNQYNTLMYQVLQLNEKLKLKEAKQRESLEQSKRKLKAHIDEENHKISSPRSSPNERNNFGDIDERINPAVFMDTPPDSQGYMQDYDMRINSMTSMDGQDGHKSKGLLPLPPIMPIFAGYQPMMRVRGQPRPRTEEYIPRRFRGPAPPFFRAKFEQRMPRPAFDPRLPLPLPTPILGMCQGECPLQPYVRSESPPPLGAPGFVIPSTDFKILDYIHRDPVKTIQIDNVPREIRFYGDTAVIMMDWDDPREIKFFPGCRRITFDNKDSVVLSFNEDYKQIEIDDQVFDIKFGAPTRELFINGRWFECFFGGQPLGVLIDGKPRLVHLEGPVPQVDIGKTKRTDLVAGKINLIVNATQMCPVYLDAKVQKFTINGQLFTIRFVDSLQTVLINEQPFKVEFGDLPKPLTIGNEKYFIRFSALPRNIKPGFVQIANMEGASVPVVKPISHPPQEPRQLNAMEPEEEQARPTKTPSPDITNENQGLDMLASVMPSSIAPASASEYSLAEPLFSKPENIPGLEAPAEENPPSTTVPILANLNVNDLFAKLLATGIVQMPADKEKEEKPDPKAEEKVKPKEDKSVIHKVDMLKPETLRVKQPGIVSKLYGGMQCSGCGTRFPPEHTVRYSQHLDWHFRQNRRERDSARRAHSRHWHYDLSDWLQYEELEELDEREKNWFENGMAEGGAEESAAGAGVPAGAGVGAGVGGAGAAGGVGAGAEAPSVAAGAPAPHHCALCGDAFHQFYNEDKEEWHLRNSVSHNGENYHPLCLDDYKASLAKEEPKQEEEVTAVDKMEEEEAIEIKDADETLDQSDNESVVEVIEPMEAELLEPVEIDEGDEDDVVLKAEPIEQVVVEDDADTDDETTASRAERDRRAEIDFSNIRIKQEPIDPDDEPIITTSQENIIQPSVDVPHTTVFSSIDGNVQFDTAPAPAATLPLGGIRINISKSIPSFIANNDDKSLEDISADDEPLPPGEEPELEYKLKPALEGIHFSKQPPLQRGNELSGLCSIM